MNNTTEPGNPLSVTFVNDVEEADIWILPQTEENLKTSLWGTAVIADLKSGEEKSVTIDDTDDGKFIVRIIDADKSYYSANDIPLENGSVIRFKTEDSKYESTIEVIDRSGDIVFSKEAFTGVLGAR